MYFFSQLCPKNTNDERKIYSSVGFFRVAHSFQKGDFHSNGRRTIIWI